MAKKKQILPLPVLPEGICAIDTHCHLDMISTEADIAEAVIRAGSCGVSGIITIGIDLESSRKAIDLAAEHSGVFAAVGIHPHNVQQLGESVYDELEALCHSKGVVAYGEIGLDYVKQYAPKPEQLEHYIRQVELAKKCGLPLIIHDREAHGTILEILQQEAPFASSGVMHCFSGDWQLATRVLDLGFFISIPGVVTFNKATILQDVARKIPLECLVLETDAPFLAPVPYRGRNNFPEYILYTARKIAELRRMPFEEIVRVTTENARRLFKLPI